MAESFLILRRNGLTRAGVNGHSRIRAAVGTPEDFLIAHYVIENAKRTMTPNAMSEESFHIEIAHAITLYERTIGHAAARTRQMIDDYGEIEALSRLMKSADLQQGFKALRDSNQLDNTFEAIVVRFPKLFSSGVVEAAKWRLENAYSLL